MKGEAVTDFVLIKGDCIVPRPRRKRVLFVGGELDGCWQVVDTVNKTFGTGEMYIRTVIAGVTFYRYILTTMQEVMELLVNDYKKEEKDGQSS